MADDGGRYFGPFGGRTETRQAIEAVCAALRLPTCSRKFPRDIGAERPCLNFHMGKCDGFCRPEMTAEEYRSRMTGFFLKPPTATTTAAGTVFLYSIDWHIGIPVLFYTAFIVYLFRVM